ncbi:MAG: hypothetical protein KA004_09690 [Verrucomicrobiales bacterium]|nr:hypothetical protein [Verrucomicrobiales bacterium]
MIQRLILGIGFGVLGVTSLRAAAPANDQMANAVSLGWENAAAVSANNAEATTQPGEPLPPGMQKTVWWKWTAPESRWMRLNTFGTWGDTVLAVYKYPQIVLPAVVVNDQAASGGWAPASEVAFYAIAGSTYYFQAGGADLVSDVFLTLCPDAGPALRLTDMVFAPNPADVTSATRTVMAYVAVQSDLPLDRGVLRLYQPDGDWFGDFLFEAPQRISGNDHSGTYRVPVSIPRFAPAGWWWAGVSLVSWSGARMAQVDYGQWGDHGFLPSVRQVVLQVKNGGVHDNACPETTVEISPNPADVTDTAKTIQIRVNVSDLSGAAGGCLTVRMPQGEPFHILGLTRDACFVGTAQNGHWLYELEIPRHAPDGQWSVDVSLRDVLGNACDTRGTFQVAGSTDPYDLWVVRWGIWKTDPNPEADPDGDGITNLLEYAFGLSPVAAEACPFTETEGRTAGLPVYFLNRPEGAPAGTASNWGVSFPRISPAADPALSYQVETSRDLQHWSADPGIFQEVTELGPPYQYVHMATTPGDSPVNFVRVRVTR